MATIFNAFGKAPVFPRGALDAVLGAAGTRMAMGALRRYPKTAIAMAVIAGAGALIGSVSKSADSKSSKPARAAKPKSRTRRLAAGAA